LLLQISLWDLRLASKPLVVSEFAGHVNAHSALKPCTDSADSVLYAGGADGRVRAWSLRTAHLLAELPVMSEGETASAGATDAKSSASASRSSSAARSAAVAGLRVSSLSADDAAASRELLELGLAAVAQDTRDSEQRARLARDSVCSQLLCLDEGSASGLTLLGGSRAGTRAWSVRMERAA
jgi:WD40 repeat protein